nr:S41 family peptidase [Ignavibacteria bacterium]
HADPAKLEFIKRELSGNDIDSLTHENLYVRLAGVVILWNVVQHSYPYFDLYNIEWERALDEAIASVYMCRSEIEFVNSLNLLLGNLNDGHCRVEYDGDDKLLFSPPFTLVYAEGKYVINRIIENDEKFRLGDIITSVNGIPVNEAAEDAAKFISSATDGLRFLLLPSKLIRGAENSALVLGILRDDKLIERETTRYVSLAQLMASRLKAVETPGVIDELKPGIYYIDLSRAKLQQIDEMAEKLASAKGLIFDVRSYPRLSYGFLGYLTDKPMLSQMWNIPQIIYPDHENFAGFDTSGRWTIPPIEPRFKGKIVFLTGPGAISYGESLMGIVEAYKLGEIVGENTAGTNGDINPVKLPGGYTAFYTGMKVLKHDGSRHHGVGISPTIPCSKSIKGIADGRDEQLEKAIEIIELFSN